MKQKVILITGGTGFVCMNIAQALLERGMNVVLFARHHLDEAAARELAALPGKLHFVCGDVTDQSSITAAIEKHSVTDIVHGAAVTPSQEAEYAHPARVIEVNCMGLIYALEAARHAKINRFLYLGSISGYGQTCFNSDVLIEGESLGDPHSLYEISKFTGERIVQRYRTLYGMDTALVRVGDVFGPWERETGVRSYMSFPFQLTRAARHGEHVILPKENCIDWVYGRDVGISIGALLDVRKLEYDAYPLCSGFRWPLTEWCRKLKERYPAFQWSLAAPGETPTMRVNQIQDNAPMQTDRLVEQTGYQPCYNLDKAFSHYMDWLTAHPFCMP